MEKLVCFRVFIASPGGLEGERQAFKDEIRDYNDSEAISRGLYFDPVGWEETLGGIGRPQSLVNQEIETCDFFIMVLWNRWGTNPDIAEGKFSSGTEEEYHLASECHSKQDKPMQGMVILFKPVEENQLSDPGPQLTKVLDFKKELERNKKHLFHTFENLEVFKKLIRRHLASWVRNWEYQKSGKSGSIADETIKSDQIEQVDKGRLQLAVLEESLTSAAWELANKGELTQAEVEFAKATIGRPRAGVLLNYGMFLHRLGRLDQAEKMLQRGAKTAKEDGDTNWLGGAFLNLGILKCTQDDAVDAAKLFTESLKIAEATRDMKLLADCYCNLGTANEMQGKSAEAEEMFKKSIELYAKLKNEIGMACVYGNLGSLLRSKGDLNGAEKMHRQSLAIEEKFGRATGIAADLGNIGTVLHDKGDLNGAEEMYRRSLEIGTKLGDLRSMLNACQNLGQLLFDRNKTEEAISLLEKAIFFGHELGATESLMKAYGTLGNLYRDKKEDFSRVMEMLGKSVDYADQLKANANSARAYLNFAAALLEKGDVQEAREFLEKSREISRKTGEVNLVSEIESYLKMIDRN